MLVCLSCTWHYGRGGVTEPGMPVEVGIYSHFLSLSHGPSAPVGNLSEPPAECPHGRLSRSELPLCLSSTYVMFWILLRQGRALRLHAVIPVLIAETNRAGGEIFKGVAASARSPLLSWRLQSCCPSVFAAQQWQRKAAGLAASRCYQSWGCEGNKCQTVKMDSNAVELIRAWR